MDLDRTIAIVGMGCAFPKAHSPEAFWELIREGRDTVEPAPAERWGVPPQSLFEAGDPRPDKVYALNGCFVDQAALALDYDALEVEADDIESLDPLFKIGLYAAQQAWRDANTENVDPSRVSVLIGNIVLPSDKTSEMCRQSVGRAFETEVLGEALPFQAPDARNRFAAGLPAGLIAKALGFGGGCVTLDAACASSLYAIQRAAETLREGRADAVISGGLSRPDCLYTQMGFSQLRALSGKGFSTPFDVTADGLIVGEGAGLFVMKRLGDALAHGDTIYGVLAGSGLSNDRDGSLLAPATEGQLRAMRQAYAEAGWQPDQVSMIECHATGTPLGDRVELESLKTLWTDAGEARQAVIGSVKSNIGHLLTAAGSASLMKVLLAMKHETLPPTARFEKAPEDIALEASPFRVLRTAEPWPAGSARCAAVSAFGFGGINAHLLIAQWLDESTVPAAAPPKVDRVDIAVVGIASHFGAFTGQAELTKALLGLEITPPEAEPLPHLGMDDPEMTRLEGFPIEGLDVPLGAFRIPPNEQKEMLPQQILMLDLASKAIADASLDRDDLGESGVFLGIGLDPNTANFQLRWFLEQNAERWWQARHPGTSQPPPADWLAALKASLGPALNANRVIGNLGGMVASRVAREFRIGGPSYTLSSEETSGLAAVEAAFRALREGRIRLALAGAVDFACDARNAVHWQRETGMPTCDGGAVLVLKRLDEARRDGDKIYGVIKGVGSANRGADGSTDATGLANERAREDGGLANPGDPSPVIWEDQNQTPMLGHAGSAHCMKALLACLLGLRHRLLPGRGKPHYWLRNRLDGPRRALVGEDGSDGTAISILLEEANPDAQVRPVVESDNQLFFLGAEDGEALLAQTLELADMAARHSGTLPAIAETWWTRTKREAQPWRLVFLCKTMEELQHRLTVAVDAFQANPDRPGQNEAFAALCQTNTTLFSNQPAIDSDTVAFVFPGSGSQFPQMGRLLSLYFPGIFDQQDALTLHMKDQLRPDMFWSPTKDVDFNNAHRELLSAQVAIGVISHDLMSAFGVKPKAIIGYSLGESSGMFATRAWTDRDKMHLQTQESDLFAKRLAGPCEAARQSWGLGPDEDVDWILGVVNCPAETVVDAIAKRKRVYLLIVNTPKECVIGGQRKEVEAVVEALQARFFALQGVVTVHCEVLEQAKEAYFQHHLFETNPPEGIDFYSGGWARRFEVSRESAAEAILEQARHGVDFPKTIRSAYADGYRTFVEMGPGASCTRMIGKILEGKPHHAVAMSRPGPKAVRQALQALAKLYALGLPVDLGPMFQVEKDVKAPSLARVLRIEVARNKRVPPAMPARESEGETLHEPIADLATFDEPKRKMSDPGASGSRVEERPVALGNDLLDGFGDAANADHLAHQTFLQLTRQQTDALTSAAAFQVALLELAEQHQLPVNPAGAVEAVPARQPAAVDVAFERDMCLEFARGSIAKVLGPEFAGVDDHPTRVRLPDEPLMLVDRIISVEGTRMKHGRVVTEHDVKHEGWYLDGGRIPTCIAVEAGQADLFLSAYLGIDFVTKGLATYRLLDAEVTFHGELPKPGQVIHYDIQIDHFFRQGKTYLFRFRFDGTVDGKPLLTMRQGCAGFFLESELDAGKGIVRLPTKPYRPTHGGANAQPLVPMVTEAYGDDKIKALREGDLVACFGAQFSGLALRKPMTLPDGAMNLVDRVLTLEPQGGPYGLGFISAEADIHPDDWFLTCHFVDDKVMPGTLMYECCLHTLRIFLMRMGWLGESATTVCQPVEGVTSRLKCRGQVLETTKKVRYEIMVKELGYGPEPYAIVDALMYSDDKCIVEIGDMSLRMLGLDEAALKALWEGLAPEKRDAGPVKPAIYDSDSILAFAVGKPSEAFGEPYRVFDVDRVIARLPGPPFMLIDRITDIQTPPWQVQAGGTIQAQYDVPADAWYFADNRQQVMPFAVLLEIALQPCGWMAAYMGSALTSETDLKFRNLGGKAVLSRPVTASSGTLTIDIKATKVATSGGMIIQNYDFVVRDRLGEVYAGDTYFGFFSKTALANQIGVRDAKLITGQEGHSFEYPREAPFPGDQMRMLDRISCYLPDGGEAGLGWLEGEMDVDPSAWFFKAHFYQDPVVPGSLGLESFLQLLKVAAKERWQLDDRTQFETTATGIRHGWEYRGQIIPSQNRVVVQAEIAAADDGTKTMTASGLLSVDGTVIYKIQDFSIRVI